MLLGQLLAVLPMLAWGAPVNAPPQDSKIRLVPQSSQNLIMDIQESKDGTRLLTFDRKSTPRLWDANTLKLLLVMRGHSDTVKWLSFSPDGKRIVTVSGNSAILWDGARAKQLQTLTPSKDNTFVTAAFSQDSKFLALGTFKGQVAVYEVAADRQPVVLTGGSAPVLDVKFTSHGNVAAACGDQVARLWSQSAPNKPLVMAFKAQVRWVDVSRDDKYVAVTSLDGLATVFEAKTGKKVYEREHFVSERSVGNVQMGAVFVGREERLLTALKLGPMVLWEPGSGQEKARLEGHVGGLREIRVSGDKGMVATAGDDQAVYVWRVSDGQKLPFKIGPGTPTAGEFSQDGSVFWMGYADGAVRAHDLATGEFRTEALGSVLDTYASVPVAGGKAIAILLPRGWWIYKPLAPNESKFLPDPDIDAPVFSGDGKYVLWSSSDDKEYPWRLTNLETGKTPMRYRNVSGVRFSEDSTRFVTSHYDATVNIWFSETGELEKSWQLTKDLSINDILFQSGTGLLMSHSAKENSAQIWNPLNANVSTLLPMSDDGQAVFAASRDGKRFAAVTSKGLRVWMAASAAYVDSEATSVTDLGRAELTFSPDGKFVALIDQAEVVVWSSENARELLRVPYSQNWWSQNTEGLFSDDSTRIVHFRGNKVGVTSLDTGKVVSNIELVEECQNAYFVGNNRLVTCDNSEGLTVWDLTVREAKRLGNSVMIRNYGWLAYDESGRFDAEDPSRATGATFVKEWEGGLEAISMEQLKSAFYEPGLMAKLLGLDRERSRDVPDLEGLRLYPQVAIQRDTKDPFKLKVKLTERDEGGIGRVIVSVNGKQVLRKQGSGFFEVDLNEQAAFLLPETLAKEGNLVQVSATNREGTLTSPPTVANVGFPSGLRVPEVRLHVLCVGVGNYPGEAGDLKAPPSDATALGEAVRYTASNLLPGRVDVTVLTTETDQRPTRSNILKWFDRMSTESRHQISCWCSSPGTAPTRSGTKRATSF